MSINPATHAIHADRHLDILTDVSPALHTSTTFRYPQDPDQLEPVIEGESVLDLSTPLVYSRLANANINRLETVLAPLIYPDAKQDELEQLANHVVSYSSGLSAFHAMLVNVVPKVVAIGEGYHGCHGVLSLHKKLHNLTSVDLHAPDSAWDAAGLGKGDIVHIETPLNPTGEATSIAHFAVRAHARGALLSVDSTFAPPGLQDPFLWGADFVMHSGTKYIGGHSDLLCGVLATAATDEGYKRALELRFERLFLGSVMGNMESWLGVRSLRTLALRVQRQANSATELVRWFSTALAAKDTLVCSVVHSVTHASLQSEPWLASQMPRGGGPVFALYMQSTELARRLPGLLQFFHHATSLGGVESLVEWRRMSDSGVDGRLVRVSVGVEEVGDLRADFERAFGVLGKEGKGKEGGGDGAI
ncbi:Cys/Met metabolism PLP-dependent enzyme-domain-containing protein [Phaeosphaeriaceae sp. PMI808]|nr:Cys/Met metabolism PLP-dependent enzyme-domain-containing protein [Phaeosphaeriaceae sp. PMI808]